MPQQGRWYVPPRGPLKGRRYASRENYKRAYEKIAGKSIRKEERYNQLLQAGILQKGAPNKKSLARFEELYRAAKASGWDTCPPVDSVPVGQRDKKTPYAMLLDYIGERPIDEFGHLCIGDTPKVK